MAATCPPPRFGGQRASDLRLHPALNVCLRSACPAAQRLLALPARKPTTTNSRTELAEQLRKRPFQLGAFGEDPGCVRPARARDGPDHLDALRQAVGNQLQHVMPQQYLCVHLRPATLGDARQRTPVSKLAGVHGWPCFTNPVALARCLCTCSCKSASQLQMQYHATKATVPHSQATKTTNLTLCVFGCTSSLAVVVCRQSCRTSERPALALPARSPCGPKHRASPGVVVRQVGTCQQCRCTVALCLLPSAPRPSLLCLSASAVGRIGHARELGGRVGPDHSSGQ